MPLTKTIEAFLKRPWPDFPDVNLLKAGELFVVAVSGGPDSLALLHALVHSAIVQPDQLAVAHLNHGLRPEADDDAAFVANLAKGWGLSLSIGRADVARLSRDGKLSLEEAGRVARYRFLGDVAERVGARYVVTGHHADDQAETVLMHLLRGAGTAGLRGMLPMGPMPEAVNALLLRPFLGTSRESIETYCQIHGLKPRIDASNLETSLFRNRLRHELLPILSEFSPHIKDRLGKMAAVLAADYELLEQLTREAWALTLSASGEGWFAFRLESWQALPLALKRATLRKAAKMCLPEMRDLGFEAIEQARKVAERGEVGSQATLPGEITLTVDYDRLVVSNPAAARPVLDLPQLASDLPIEIAVPGRFHLGSNWILEVSEIDHLEPDQAEANQDPWQAYLARDVSSPLIIRTKRPGERFKPLGMGGKSAKLSDVMINRKIPFHLRERWPIIANPEHLVWLPGHHLDERARLTRSGEAVLRLRLRPVAQVDGP